MIKTALKWIAIYAITYWVSQQIFTACGHSNRVMAIFFGWSLVLYWYAVHTTASRLTKEYGDMLAAFVADLIVAAESKPSTPAAPDGHVDATQLPDLKQD